MHWIRLGLGIGVACAGVACIVGFLFGASRLAPPPRSYREAVMQVLDQQDIPYTDVQISDWCPPMPQCWQVESDVDTTYTAQVVVDGAQLNYGRMVCQHRQTDCALTIVAFALHGVRLPPLAQDQPWLEALKRPMHTLEAWLRTWTAHLRHP